MHIPDMQNPASRGYLKGLAHFAIAVGKHRKGEYTHRTIASGWLHHIERTEEQRATDTMRVP